MLEPLYAGENALEPERVTEKLHQNTFWMGRGGTLTHTISGIDIALWDILGKATGQPVGRLLGGSYRKRVQPYCSLLMEEPERMRRVVSAVTARRASARSRSAGVRSAAATDSKLDEAIVRAAREAVGATASCSSMPARAMPTGRTASNGRCDTAQMLADYDVGWFEEALRARAHRRFLRLRRHSPVPIAGGEVLTRRQSFLPWLTRGAFDIVQPDVTKVGGISEQRRIAWMADEFGVSTSATAGTPPSASQPTFSSPPRSRMPILSNSSAAAPMSTVSCGALHARCRRLSDHPDLPGLGVELDRDKLARYTPDAGPLFAS